MATTSRRLKTKTTERIKPVENIEHETLAMFPDELSPVHLMALEVKSRDIENLKLSMAMEEQVLRNLLLEEQLLKNMIEKQRLTIQQKASQYDGAAQLYKQIKTEIWPQYGFAISDKLSYDAQSGKIIKMGDK